MASKKYVFFLIASLVCSLYTNAVFGHSRASFEKVAVSIDDKALKLEYANTPELRSHGLQHRKVLCDDCGMLFQFEKSHVASFWMKDTFLPLDIAFVQSDGIIVHIAQMEPFNLKMESSKESVLYAIEMNQGWFVKHDVKVGDKVNLGQLTEQ